MTASKVHLTNIPTIVSSPSIVIFTLCCIGNTTDYKLLFAISGTAEPQGPVALKFDPPISQIPLDLYRPNCRIYKSFKSGLLMFNELIIQFRG